VCDALLDLFVNIGVPKVIISDCGTNFTSQLTREMLCKLGCTPRFNRTGHPEASGMVERFNQTCKKMLHLGIAIPGPFSNHGISGLRNANPGIPGLVPGLGDPRIPGLPVPDIGR